ncbi:MAG: hypothetical protein HFF36_01915 [Coprobacillus sp.]|nr:hypothetical protein [Coprobacillus sp.]
MKERKLTVNIGIISFMIIFIILCLITFSVLSLVSAQSNLNMTTRTIEHTNEYYQLSCKGENSLKQIDDYLYEIYKNSSKENYYQKLTGLKTIIPHIKISNHDVSYTITEKNQQLHIQLEIIYPGKQLYKIKAWKIQPNHEWTPEQKMEIL